MSLRFAQIAFGKLSSQSHPVMVSDKLIVHFLCPRNKPDWSKNVIINVLGDQLGICKLISLLHCLYLIQMSEYLII
jgi:hypothetical protein